MWGLTGRVVVAIAALGAVFAAAFAFLFSRDDDEPVRGDLIAYGCKERDNAWFAVCVMRTDGTEKRHITEGVETSEPAWSPDGRRIAFTRNEDVGESTTFTDDDVFVMDADGGDPRQLTEEVDGLMSGQPTWSSDGRELAFVRGESVHSTVPSRFGDLMLMSADGADVRRLVPGPAQNPHWSADGRMIVYVLGTNLASQDGTAEIHVVDVETGTSRQLTKTPLLHESAPVWSPDGSLIAFARWTNATQFDGKATIHVMRPDGTGERLVLAHEHFASGPSRLSWSPDGRMLAFETSASRECSVIALVGVRDGSVRRLTSCARPAETAVGPAWQPAGADS
jgi:Tol biopolymer transport system component